jgi:hypothetical protein
MVTLLINNPAFEAAHKAVQDGQDEMRSIDSIALTVISACIGMNTSKMPASPNTLIILVVVMIGMLVFHHSLRLLYNAVYFRQFRRACIVFSGCAPVCVLMALAVGDFVGNIYLGSGLFLGWFMMFAFMLASGHFSLVKLGSPSDE